MEQELLALLDNIQSELDEVRSMGDLILTTFFNETTKTARERARRDFAQLIVEGGEGTADLIQNEVRLDVDTFHWGIEFPEVFDRDNPGFDAIVGNPPFQGGRNLSAALGQSYAQWLTAIHEGSSGGADLVAHFFRRAFDLVRESGSLGLIATNTIGQGDTRSSGLRWICNNGGTIFRAQRRVKWPGEAAVVVSVIHVMKAAWEDQKYLDGNPVDTITAFLFHNGVHDDPARLLANAEKSFQGSIVLGMGFTFDDTDSSAVATPISVLDGLLEKDPDNQQVIFPYIGGEEVNTSPRHSHHRYIIDFEERDEDYCRNRWPDLFAIVERNVKPSRINKDSNKYPRMVLEWWKYWNSRIELRSTIEGLETVLAISRVGQQGAFTFLPTGSVYADSLVIFPYETYSAFCTLQSRPHEIWARFFASSMKDDLRYTPSDCFETFPFPENWESHPQLEKTGEEYYQFRAELMVRKSEGMTKTYNRFHDPDENGPDIVRLRELHTKMDRAVLDAYGWTDVPTACQFLLDFEIDEEEYRRKKKPWRYRWPDEVRDDVLARLLALNGERAQLERIVAKQAKQNELLKV